MWETETPFQGACMLRCWGLTLASEGLPQLLRLCLHRSHSALDITRVISEAWVCRPGLCRGAGPSVDTRHCRNVWQTALGSVKPGLLLCPVLFQGGSLRDTLHPKFDAKHSEDLTGGRHECPKSRSFSSQGLKKLNQNFERFPVLP